MNEINLPPVRRVVTGHDSKSQAHIQSERNLTLRYSVGNKSLYDQRALK